MCVAVAGFVAQFFLWPEADVSWLLMVARRMNAGEVLYSRDIVEVNLPLILQLNAAIVSLSDWLHVDPLVAWRCAVALAAVGSATLAWHLLRPALVASTREMHAAVALTLATALFAFPGVAFGQREHLVVLGLVPYAIAAGRRAQGLAIASPVAVLAGACLSLGLAIKPHYVLAVPLIEFALVRHLREARHLIRLETVSAAAVMTALILDVLWGYPQFIATALPLALTYYGEYGAALVTVPQVGLLGLAVAAGFVPGVPRGIAVHSRLLACGAVGAYGGFLLQDQGWPYQTLPAQTYAWIAIGLPALAVANDVAERGVAAWPRARRSLYASGVLGLAVLVLVSWIARRTVRANAGERGRIVEHVAAFVDQVWPTGAPRTLTGITLSLFPAVPVAELERASWASRFSCLWPLPGIRARERRAADGRPDLARTFLESAMVDDFARWHPTIVLVQRGEADVLDDMLRAPAFRAVWADYRLAGTVEQIDVFVHVDD